MSGSDEDIIINGCTNVIPLQVCDDPGDIFFMLACPCRGKLYCHVRGFSVLILITSSQLHLNSLA